MSNDSAIESEKFVAIPIPADLLQKLSRDQKLFFISACLILAEINNLVAFSRCCPVDATEPLLREMQISRQMWAGRKLGAAVFEAQIAIRNYGKTIPAVRKYFSKDQNLPFTHPQNFRFLKIAKRMRDQTTNHFAPEKLAEAVGLHSLTNEGHIFASSDSHQVYASVCEQLFVQSEMTENSSFEIQEFMNWCYYVAGEISCFCDNSLSEILKEKLPSTGDLMEAFQASNEFEKKLGNFTKIPFSF